jgi:hypothetical protein
VHQDGVSDNCAPSGYEWGEYDWEGYSGDVYVLTKLAQSDPEEYEEVYNQIALQVFLYFTDVCGFGAEAACGLLGNFTNEANFDTTSLERPVDSWDDAILGKTGMGLAGFTSYVNMDILGNNAYEAGVEWTDLEIQMKSINEVVEKNQIWLNGKKYAIDENGSPVATNINTLDDFHNASVYVASALFTCGYEICQGYTTYAVQSTRANDGQKWYEKLKDHYGEEYDAKNNPSIVSTQGTYTSKDKTDSDSIPSEYELEGMPSKVDWKQRTVEGLKSSDLTTTEQIKVSKISSDISSTKLSASKIASGFFTFLGILLLIYSILLVFAASIDVAFPFLDISLVELFTFKKYRINTDYYGTGKHVVSYTKFIFLTCIPFALGLILVTGQIANALFFIMKSLARVWSGLG